MKLLWDQSGERFYENGVRRGVIYPWDNNAGWYGTGVAWNGLTSVQVTPSGGEANPQYADDMKYLNLYSVEENGATVECFTYPDEFTECDGSAVIAGTNGLMARAQSRKQFGFCWRTNVGNDETEEAGYILHILYGCKASPSERQYQTINDSPEPISFSYEITTIPPAMPATLSDYKNTALFEIDSRKFVTTEQQALLTGLENKLYGTSETDPELPTIEELVALLGALGLIRMALMMLFLRRHSVLLEKFLHIQEMSLLLQIPHLLAGIQMLPEQRTIVQLRLPTQPTMQFIQQVKL